MVGTIVERRAAAGDCLLALTTPPFGCNPLISHLIRSSNLHVRYAFCLNSWVSPSSSVQPTPHHIDQHCWMVLVHINCSRATFLPPRRVDANRRRRAVGALEINSNIYLRQLFMKKLWFLKLVIYWWGTYKLEIIRSSSRTHKNPPWRRRRWWWESAALFVWFPTARQQIFVLN